MTLPEFLTQEADGDMSVTGHRIGLFHVVEHFRAHPSIESLRSDFPTLTVSLLEQVIRFYQENQAEVDQYVDRYRADLDQQEKAHPPSAALLEMRRRLAAQHHPVNSA